MAKQFFRQQFKEEFEVVMARRNLSFFSEYCWKDDPESKANGLFQKEWYWILQANPQLALPEGSAARLRQDLIDFVKTRRLHLEARARLCIPKALINETYRVFVNWTEMLPTPLPLPCSNSTHNYLYFNYTRARW